MGIEYIKIVGAGGIGSHLCSQIVQKLTKNQFRDLKEITIYDPDTLELKNKLYTTYDCDETQIGEKKVVVLKEQLELTLMSLDRKVSIVIKPEKLPSFDFQSNYHSARNTVFISSVDGSSFREKLFKEGTTNWFIQKAEKDNLHWIDCRSKGAKFVISRNPISPEGIGVLEPYFQHSTIEGDSCQVTADLERNLVQVGNELAATSAVKFLLNIDRGAPNELFIDYKSIPDAGY